MRREGIRKVPGSGAVPRVSLHFALELSLLLVLSSCGGPYRTRTGLVVDFEGNDRISSSRLWEIVRPEVKDFDESGNETRLSDASFRIAHVYELEGRENTRVDYVLEGGRVLFRIEEARYYALGKIRIDGARDIPEKELLEELPHQFLGRVPYSELLLRELTGKIRSLYEDRGFRDVRLGTPETRPNAQRHEVEIRLSVQEGKRYRIVSIDRPEGMEPDLAKRLRDLEGKPFTPQSPEEIRAAVLDSYRDHGFPYVHIRIEPEFGDGTVKIHLQVDPGAYARVGAVEVEGLHRATRSFVLGRADLDLGKEVRASDLRRAEERLAATSLFETVQAEPGPEDPESSLIPIVLRLQEREPGEVAFRLGYGTLDGGRAGVDLRYANVLGNAELFRIGGTVSRFGYRAESEVAFPYFLGSEYRPGLSGYYETETYPSFDAVSFGGVVSVSRPLVKNVTATLGVRHAVIRTTHVDLGVPPGDLLDFSYTAPFLSLHWDGRDNALLPTRGGLFDVRIEYSDRSYSPDIQFWNLSGKTSYLIPLPWALTFGASFQGGLIGPVEDTTEIPISLRYFAGGTNTVRGFAFASLGPEVNGAATGGESFLALQAEIRYPIWGDLHGAVFTDRGGVWADYARVNLTELRYSVGTGLRYHTPAGPLVADVAWNPARRAGEDGWAFHFSIGFPF